VTFRKAPNTVVCCVGVGEAAGITVPPGEAGAAVAAVPGEGSAADVTTVNAAVPNDAGRIWDDGKGEDEEAKAVIPTHSSNVWISVIVDSKGCVDSTECDENGYWCCGKSVRGRAHKQRGGDKVKEKL